MKSRPILMSGPMVRPTYLGDKTQTRRLLKTQPLDVLPMDGDRRGYHWVGLMQRDPSRGQIFRCHLGQPGDHLWVKETWTTVERYWDLGAPREIRDDAQIIYRADGHKIGDRKWRTSLFMQARFSRLTLEITDVRVERLRDISKEDAIAEGLKALTKDGGTTFKYGIPDRDGWPGNDDDGWHWHEWEKDPREAYFRLWAKINGEASLKANPFVWAITFKRVHP